MLDNVELNDVRGGFPSPTVRYGAKLLEFERGKAAIAVGDNANLIHTIDAVLAAAAAGELDAAITATQKTGQKPKAKAA